MCGMCCKDCSKLVEESLNDIKRKMCSIQWRKPTDCALFPCTPDKENYPTCGYVYKEISKETFIKELIKMVE